MSTTAHDNDELPSFSIKDFEFAAEQPPECDMIMKGGITSGMVYPYAVLQIATRYKLRSLGGTSAGGIAAAFAAAAEFARQQGRPDGFMTMKKYCDQLPERLPTLFQPDPKLKKSAELIQEGLGMPFLAFLKKKLWLAARWGALGLLLASGIALGLDAAVGTLLFAAIFGFLGGGVAWIIKNVVCPACCAIKTLPKKNYGFCSGLTQPGNDSPALTNWIYHALQDIAFGDKDHPTPLTFGHLIGDDPKKPKIDLKMVTTNLSMGRPHTLPRLGILVGFMAEEWRKIFPTPVMQYLENVACKSWYPKPEALTFPKEDRLPVIVAVRMSLSFPLLFTTIPLLMEDYEFRSIATQLGAPRPPRSTIIRNVYFSDGGLSSNFPIHMFDSPLPSRPTFAFSLEALLCDKHEVNTRVTLPETSSQATGVQITTFASLLTFAARVIDSAKGWQDQLLSEITGQRERIVRIFLAENEGGINLNMPASVSTSLMKWGYEAGCKFTTEFDFDEHKWRRLLVLYKHLEHNFEAIDNVWKGGYAAWYQQYSPVVKTYKKVKPQDRIIIMNDINSYLATYSANSVNKIALMDKKFPRKAGALKVAPKY